MKKKKISQLDTGTLDRLVPIEKKKKKPFEVLKEEFGVTENEVTELMQKRLSKDNLKKKKKKVTASKPKPKPIKYNELEDEDLDSKYYFKNKFD